MTEKKVPAKIECDLCQAPSNKTRYVLKKGDETLTICPECNRHVQRKRNKRAVDEFYDRA